MQYYEVGNKFPWIQVTADHLKNFVISEILQNVPQTVRLSVNYLFICYDFCTHMCLTESWQSLTIRSALCCRVHNTSVSESGMCKVKVKVWVSYFLLYFLTFFILLLYTFYFLVEPVLLLLHSHFSKKILFYWVKLFF